MERFDRSHPRERPHYYLSLLGTANAHRGKGTGMQLLRDNLAVRPPKRTDFAPALPRPVRMWGRPTCTV